jgi:hypothetical protein
MLRRLPVWLILALITLLPLTTAYLQGQTCPPLVERALLEAGDQCANLPRNAACYGFNQVNAAFSVDVAEDFFTTPADVSELLTLESLNTASLDEALDRWGVAVLNVQANLPNSLPGQGVRFILFGDVALENAVPADQVIVPAPPVDVTVNTNANIRSGPSTRTNVIGSAAAGSTLPAEGVNPAGDWVRIDAGEIGVGWIFRELITPAGDLGSLPVISEESRTPMQAFQFRTGLGPLSCAEAPSALVIQGPEDVQVSITANGVDVTLGSTIILKTDDDTMYLMTVDGEAQANGLRIPEGYMAQSALDEEGQGGPFGDRRRISREELEELGWLDGLPGTLLNYGLDVPTYDQVRPISTPAPQPTAAPGQPTPANPVANPGTVDCSTFRASSPLDGARFGFQTFYWDPAPGATSYRLTVVNLGSIEVPATQTTVDYDLAGLGGVFSMTWFVEALSNGAVACRSLDVTIPRESPPPMQAFWGCIDQSGTFEVRWQDLPPDTTSLRFNLPGGPTSPGDGYEIAGPPRNGSQVFTMRDNVYGASVTAFPSGQTVFLGDLFCFSSD